ncbi:MAG: pilus assembly protein PilM [Chloroflexi bacterium]|nr:pilus assembly protein PilM [Chloroflexota bacterium]
MYVTLDIGASSIKLLSVKRGKVDKWGMAPLAPGLVRDGLIQQPQAVAAAIDDLFKETNVPKQSVITSLTGLTFTYRTISLPRIKPALIPEAIQRAARKEMPLPLEELYLSWQVIGDEENKVDFLVLGVPRSHVDVMVQTLVIVGIKPYLMDLKPLALVRAAHRRDAVIVDLGPDYFHIVLVSNGVPAIMHTITPRGKGASLEDHVQQTINELSRIMKFHRSSHPDNPLSPSTPLLLTGELSSDGAAGTLIQSEVEYPVQSLVPPLNFPPDMPLASYTSNMGLALKKVPPKAAIEGETPLLPDININILSSKYRKQAKPIPLRKILAISAFAIVIILLTPMYQLRSKVDAMTVSLQTRFNTVSHELQATLSAADKAKQVEDTITGMVASTNALRNEHRSILDKKGDLSDNLKLVTSALPNGASFSHIGIGAAGITVEGEANSVFVVISYVTSLVEYAEFSEVRIAEITEGNIIHNGSAESSESGTTGVSFTIVIEK